VELVHMLYCLRKTMELYGLQEGVALAFGWILWLVQTFVILIGGIFSFAAIPYFNKEELFLKRTDFIQDKIFSLPQLLQRNCAVEST
jgi:hypothetical protein